MAVNYEEKKFYGTGPWSPVRKTGFDRQRKSVVTFFVVKQLSPNLLNWRPAVQSYFRQQ